jgi:hypothetical protein
MNKLLVIFIALAVAGCKVEQSEESSGQDGGSRFTGGCTPRSYEELSVYGYGCKETIPRSSSSGGTGGDPGGMATNTSRPAGIARYAEYEPNGPYGRRDTVLRADTWLRHAGARVPIQTGHYRLVTSGTECLLALTITIMLVYRGCSNHCIASALVERVDRREA